MDDLYELFHRCAYDVIYEETGHSANYAFEEKGDKLIIYFQGSNSIWDWVRNFLFKKKPYKDMAIPYKVHRGFLAAWKEVEDIIIAKVTERKSYGEWEYRWKEIVVVGYSHGGALSGLCHECVWFHRPDLRNGMLRGYGFESPRFYGGWKVKKALRERWERYTVIRTNEDIVTHCPPWLFAFTHVGKFLKTEADVEVCSNKSVPNCVKSHYPEVVLDGLERLES